MICDIIERYLNNIIIVFLLAYYTDNTYAIIYITNTYINTVF